MLLASATLLTGCSIGGKEIVLDINTTNSHTVFSVDNMKCDKTEALIYLANYKNLYGTMYDVNLLETDDASNVCLLGEHTVDLAEQAHILHGFNCKAEEDYTYRQGEE